MPRHKTTTEKIERVTLKLPASVAQYFRKAFPHGKRSQFVADCLHTHEREQRIKAIENELRAASPTRH